MLVVTMGIAVVVVEELSVQRRLIAVLQGRIFRGIARLASV
jgi:hypothetical protein